MKLVGLTGGIACGKTTVSKLLAQAGIPVLDADLIAHSITEKGRWGYRRVVAAFGSSILRSNGEIDREALAALVFQDAGLRRRLNAATHPAIGAALAARILLSWLQCRPVLVVDMPLLFETGFSKLTSPNVLVACSSEVQLQRLMQRDALAQAAAQARIASQMPLEAKRQLSNLVLENDGSQQELKEQAEQLIAQLRRHAWLHRWLLSPLGLLAAVAVAALLQRLF